jgi:hypothetical protein
MTWQPLGSIKPGYGWQQFGEPRLTETAVRVSHTYNRRPDAFAVLRFELLDGYFGTTRLYPSPSQRLITVRIPPALFEGGAVVWYPALTLGKFSRITEPDNWTVILESWSNPAPSTSNFDRQLDELLTDVERIEQKLDQQGTNNPAFTDQVPNNNVDTP